MSFFKCTPRWLWRHQKSLWKACILKSGEKMKWKQLHTSTFVDAIILKRDRSFLPQFVCLPEWNWANRRPPHQTWLLAHRLTGLPTYLRLDPNCVDKKKINSLFKQRRRKKIRHQFFGGMYWKKTKPIIKTTLFDMWVKWRTQWKGGERGKEIFWAVGSQPHTHTNTHRKQAHKAIE